jgi:hypothetical protein
MAFRVRWWPNICVWRGLHLSCPSPCTYVKILAGSNIIYSYFYTFTQVCILFIALQCECLIYLCVVPDDDRIKVETCSAE